MNGRATALQRLGVVDVPTGRVLRSLAEVEAAAKASRSLGLAPNPVEIKSWDNLLAIRLIAALDLKRDAPIVDLGCRSGILLTWLDQLGFRNLYGCDLRTPAPPLRSAIKKGLWHTVIASSTAYLRHRRRMFTAPVEDTGLPDRSFDVVTSMSVIEHGVDLRRFFTEAARLLRSGGTLVISTDYWPVPIDVGTLRRFEVSHGKDRIFDRDAVVEMCDLARTVGFVGPATFDLDAEQPVVFSSGFSYTFLLLAFRRRAW